MIIPDKIGVIEGWRGWNINIPIFEISNELKSMTIGTIWKPNEIVSAKCGGETPVYWDINYSKYTDEAYAELKMETGHGTTELTMLEELPEVVFEMFPDLFIRREPHFSPKESCTCGIHSVKTFDQILDSYNNLCVFGKVKSWGSIVEGEKGYRAEFAYPSEFYLNLNHSYNKSPEYKEKILQVLKNWNIPIKAVKTNISYTVTNLEGYII